MKKQTLIKHMTNALKIHKEWAEIQHINKKLGKSIIPNVGDEKWHLKWIKIYESVIEELKKLV